MIFDRVSIKTRLDYEPELFYEVPIGAIYPIGPIPKNTVLEVGRRIPLLCMLELYEVLSKDVRVGYLFKSSFAMECHGGYLITYLKGKGEAESHEVLLKLENLIIYNFPNRGAMAASPRVAGNFLKILENQ